MLFITQVHVFEVVGARTAYLDAIHDGQMIGTTCQYTRFGALSQGCFPEFDGRALQKY